MKLIEHGTEFGVPESELPDPSCAFSMTKHNKKGAISSKTPAEAVTRNSANYASSYQLKQKVATRPPSGVVKKLNNTLTNSTIVNSKGGITESQNKTEMRGSIALKTRNTSRQMFNTSQATNTRYQAIRSKRTQSNNFVKTNKPPLSQK